MLTLALSVALLAAGDSRSRVPDHVQPKSGAKATGRVVYADEQRVVLQDGSRRTEFARKDVVGMRSRADLSRVAMGEWNALAEGDVPGLLGLADRCAKDDLLEEADLLAWRVLVLDPANEGAHGLLGHAKRGKGWTFQEGARHWDFAKRDEVHRDFGSAWRFTTPHFELRTNLPVARALDMAFDLENVYQAFYACFGRELGLYEVLERIGADVHADKQSFPEQVGGRIAWYDVEREVLVVDASRVVDASDTFERGAVFHEASHALVHATSTRARNNPAAVPAWVDEGLAEYMCWSMGGPNGHAGCTPGFEAKAHFRTHAEHKDPLELSRVLTLSSGDFAASSKSDLKYAQCYTLVHFLLHGDGGALRPPFLAFVRGAYGGQGSPTHFKKAMGGDIEALERGWQRWAREHAGG